ncbi:MAG: hypothetical protein Q9227_002339 [Pyrenula ochraceoflavens]
MLSGLVLLLLAAFSCALPSPQEHALQGRNGWTTLCTTSYASMTAPLSSIPTSTFNTIPSSTVTSTVTPTTTQTLTITIPSATSTSTIFTPGRPTVTWTNTVDSFNLTWSTVGTAIFTSTLCPTTPLSTSTVYTGLYRGTSAAPNVFPAEVDCTTIFDWPETSTVTESTTTVTASTTVTTSSYISTTTITWGNGITSYYNPDTTITSTIHQTGYTAVASSTTVSASSCPETTTVTQSAACAPSNLVSAARSGFSIKTYTYGPGIGQATWGFDLKQIGDPSSCCQLCEEIERCVASASDPEVGTCNIFLEDPASQQCGAIEYSDGGMPDMEQAWIFQAGCGTLVEQ